MKPGARRLERTGIMGATDRTSFSSCPLEYRIDTAMMSHTLQRSHKQIHICLWCLSLEGKMSKDETIYAKVSQRLWQGRRNEDTIKEAPPGYPPSMYIRDIEEHMRATNQVNVPSKESSLRKNIHPLRTPYAFRDASRSSPPTYPQPFKHCVRESAPHSDITNINDIEYKGEQ